MDVYVGFDSAWTDNPKAPGAICAVGIESGRPAWFRPPEYASFDQALMFIRDIRSENGVTLIAIDQPTVVPNLTKTRPVDRISASLISWVGGGVQPANRGKTGMFDDAAPIWRFIRALGAREDPVQAHDATGGLWLMEVFPALALPSMDATFFGRLAGPRYNPTRRKTYKLAHWVSVANAAARDADTMGCADLADWCRAIGMVDQPRKAHQDELDAVICVLIALRWRLRPRAESMLIGDLKTGYMVLPASPQVREYLDRATIRQDRAGGCSLVSNANVSRDLRV